MSSKINLERSNSVIKQIDLKQKKQIRALYTRAYKEVTEKIKSLEGKQNISSILGKQQLIELRKKIVKEQKKISDQIKEDIKKQQGEIIEKTLKETITKPLKDFGIEIGEEFSSVRGEIISSIASGKVYEGDWTLSKALWKDIQKKQSDINKVIAQGVAENKGSYEIAKDLEKYVDPEAKKEWEWSKVYPGTNKKIDYNAQRLARTMVSHAYQQSIIVSTEGNPFVKGIRWLATNNHERTCDLCKKRAKENKYGLGPGIYPPDKLPMDHPNGLCIYEIVQESLQEVSKQLSDWAFGKPNEKLDNWFNMFSGKKENEQIKGQIKDKIGNMHKVVNGKNVLDKWKRREGKFDFEIEDVINFQGFDGLPRIVDEKEFEKLVKQSKFIAQRIYSANTQEILDAYRDQLYNGKWYVDCGTGGAQYGQGMYCAADWDGILSKGIKEEMKHYRELNEKRGNPFEYTETFTLDESAKAINYDKLVRLQKSESGSVENYEQSRFLVENVINNKELTEVEKSFLFHAFDEAMITDKLSLEDIEKYDKIYNENVYNNKNEFPNNLAIKKQRMKIKSKLSGILGIDSIEEYIEEMVKKSSYVPPENILKDMDIGSYAVLRGYDVINAEGHGESGSYTIILNRTKLVIKRG